MYDFILPSGNENIKPGWQTFQRVNSNTKVGCRHQKLYLRKSSTCCSKRKGKRVKGCFVTEEKLGKRRPNVARLFVHLNEQFFIF
jgi:hypothetical protein